jgi:urease accessory protein
MPARKILCIASLLWLMLVAAASAHPVAPLSDTHAWIAGLSHPWSGWDHWLAMVTVGLFAVQLGGRALWGLPLGFLAGMIVGFGMGWLPLGVPGVVVELAIACSVAILGLCVLTAKPATFGLAVVLVTLCGLFHGHAHGTELPASAAVASYFLGMVLSTAVLHACGLLIGWSAVRSPAGVWALRLSGSVVAAAGLMLVLSWCW